MYIVGARKGYKQTPDHVARRMASKAATVASKPSRIPVTGHWLREQYVDFGRTCPDIAAEVGRDPKTVWNWMQKFGIPTRPRGTYWAENLEPGRKPGFKLTDEHKDRIRQARLEDGHVPYLRNGVHWLHTVDREQHPNWKGGHTAERQAFYASPEWKAVLPQVWRRSDARCERCGKRHNTDTARGTFHIHHLLSFSTGLRRADLDNLALLCQDCHRWVHSNLNTEKKWITQR